MAGADAAGLMIKRVDHSSIIERNNRPRGGVAVHVFRSIESQSSGMGSSQGQDDDKLWSTRSARSTQREGQMTPRSNVLLQAIKAHCGARPSASLKRAACRN